jgi:adenosylmethionine---8-amino-7-oxononanoate aminotransferase
MGAAERLNGRAPSPYNRTMLTQDARHLWHPFTQAYTEPPPLPIVRAAGASVFTSDGREILDLISSWWVITHGHCHPSISEAIARQAHTLDQVLFAGCTHAPAVELAVELTQRLPPTLSRVFYSDNGSTAVEVALKMALQYWQNQGHPRRTRLLALEGGYHGDTFGAMAAGRSSGFFTPFEPYLPSVHFLPCPFITAEEKTVYDGEAPSPAALTTTEQHALNAAENMLDRYDGELALLILEPLLQGASGMRMIRPAFVNALVRRAQAAGILVIFDEILTGFGRTGTLFALEQTGVVPDLLCLAKGLTGGSLPLSVTVCSDALFDAFKGNDFHRAFAHGHSFTANPISCAAALASLALFTTENTIERVQQRHQEHLSGLHHLQKSGIGVQNPRTLGAVAAFELADHSGKQGYHAPIGARVREKALAHQFLLRPLGNTVYVLPPYGIEQLRTVYETLGEILGQCGTG